MDYREKEYSSVKQPHVLQLEINNTVRLHVETMNVRNVMVTEAVARLELCC